MASFQNIDPEILKSFSEALQTQINEMQKVLKPFKKVMQDYMNAINDNRESLKVFAEEGWYLRFDFHPITINHYSNELKKGNSEYVDEEMVRLFDNEINSIESELVKKFPKRKAVIQAGLRAHRNQEYYLSIPVLFSQSEGICLELTGFRFFKLPKQKPATEAWISNFNSDSILEIALEPLRQVGVARQLQDLSNPLGINRHDVIHGNSVDYGEDKINSYKALSLLNYLGETVYFAKQHFEENKNQINPKHPRVTK